MNARQTRRVYWLIAGVLAASSALTLVGGALLPYDAPPPQIQVSARPATLPSAAAVPPLEAFAEYWDHPFRAALTDSPAMASSPAATMPTSDQASGVRLVGTVVEPGHSYALLVNAQGQLEFKGVGAEVDGVEVVEIGQDTVKVRSGERVDTLTVPVPQSR